MTTATLLLAQDDERVETSVLRLVREHFALVGIVADGAALVEAANQLLLDAVIVDSDLAGSDGLSATTAIHQRFPTIAIVVMTGDADHDFWRKAFGAGAAAFKAEVADKLITVVRSLVASSAAGKLLNEIGTPATVPTARARFHSGSGRWQSNRAVKTSPVAPTNAMKRVAADTVTIRTTGFRPNANCDVICTT